jgi:hypothetical protein
MASNAALIGKLEEIAPVDVSAAVPTGGQQGNPVPAAPTLTSIAGQLIGSVMSVQGSEMPPTAAELACTKQESAFAAMMARWSALKAAVQ